MIKMNISSSINIWDPEQYIRAWKFACVAHHRQFIPSSQLPYINHLSNVAMECMCAIARNEVTIDNPNLLIQSALLHDVIEDTDTSYEDLNNLFGVEVADGVLALTKNKSLSKTEQLKDSLERIKKQPTEVWMVKLSDRITNLQAPPKHWQQNKIITYRNEAILILEELGEANFYLGQRLKDKIDQYQQYI
jgi:(p)ppGpp synthase/HD superfamily hydrolase